MNGTTVFVKGYSASVQRQVENAKHTFFLQRSPRTTS